MELVVQFFFAGRAIWFEFRMDGWMESYWIDRSTEFIGFWDNNNITAVLSSPIMLLKLCSDDLICDSSIRAPKR